MLDKRLLYVERYLEQPNETVDLTEVLELSQRQLTRLLNTWQEDGYITYQPGVGRGNKMKIQLNLDVERELFFQLRNNMNKLSLQEIQEYLTLPWHPNSEQAIRRNLMEEYEEDDKVLMDYVYHIPKEFHPSKSIDLVTTTIIYQIYDTLFRVDKDGHLNYHILRYDEWVDNVLHLYLKKSIFFSNGDLMVAEDVCNSLRTLQKSALYKHLFKDLLDIVVIDDFHIELIFTQKINYIRYMLSESFCAVYKEIDGTLIGTGSYAIDSINNDEIILKVNKYNGMLRPDIRTIYLIDNMDKYYAYNTTKYSGGKITTVYRGNDFLLFNPNTKLTLEQRLFIKDVSLFIAIKNSEKREILYKWIGEDCEELPSKEDVPKFDAPFKVIADEYTLSYFEDMKRVLAAYDIETEIIKLTHYEYLEIDIKELDGDFVWMSESYHQTQPLKTLNLLSHCKFLEWYRDEDDGKEIFELAASTDDETFRPIATKYIDDIIEDCYAIPLQIKHRVLTLPEGLKNIIELPYGVLDYSQIILTK